MATRTITSLVDDADGSEAQETVELGLEGTTYEIDLSNRLSPGYQRPARPAAGRGPDEMAPVKLI
jgi:hypothetical protein